MEISIIENMTFDWIWIASHYILSREINRKEKYLNEFPYNEYAVPSTLNATSEHAPSQKLPPINVFAINL